GALDVSVVELQARVDRHDRRRVEPGQHRPQGLRLAAGELLAQVDLRRLPPAHQTAVSLQTDQDRLLRRLAPVTGVVRRDGWLLRHLDEERLDAGDLHEFGPCSGSNNGRTTSGPGGDVTRLTPTPAT